MAWTHFTDYLAGSGTATQAKMNELFDAFIERLLATGGDAAVDSGYLSDLKGRRVPTRTIEYRDSENVLRNEDLHLAINRVANKYNLNSTTIFGFFPFGNGSATRVAGNDLGYTDLQTDTIMATPVKTLAYLDICRRALMLLRYVSLIVDGFNENPARRESVTAAAAGWSNAKTTYYATSETSDGDLNGASFRAGYEGTDYRLTGERREFDVMIPEIDPFDTYDLWAFVAAQNEDLYSVSSSFVPDELRLTIGSSTGAIILTSPGFGIRGAIGTGLGDKGALASELVCQAYDDDTFADDFEPELGEVFVFRGIIFSPASDARQAIVAAPTFTHPFEAL